MTEQTALKDNHEALEILDTEGTGYAVTDYIRGDAFADPETARLWAAARTALSSLCTYLEEDTGRELGVG